ncbi:MAG: glycine cleavage system protein H [Sphingomonadales bacterium CG12_big_fil_rev_8_21_14_0_65_65_10]|jgi:glycine cleavage system H protein|uniref:Glycine cleavage system H protein n=1 Tax=Blastomonas marina TaxID=1867408 RepID=A0ABQ1FDZ7_9SPHN|nr:glycine cleavage system protein GcvH [Blastomonas marina]PIW54658.1 MAG: glycine cleavage system protein H [Sphingomonadales bacterium CG12_big_fil_rev_8_21_14_0_65_65_10]WPZ05200.1 glycine cleavage system protein GcvH [Blastomonas marina]GGA06660.1 glycine cleavage system H protein [Blastomonas marina]
MPRYFTEDHEWIDVDGDVGTVGITDYAQSQLGDITFVELPEKGDTLKKGDAPCVVDSVKAASDVYAPVSGEVVEVNGDLDGEPELVNNDAEGDGWFFKIRLSNADELSGLMDEDKYSSFVDNL